MLDRWILPRKLVLTPSWWGRVGHKPPKLCRKYLRDHRLRESLVSTGPHQTTQDFTVWRYVRIDFRKDDASVSRKSTHVDAQWGNADGA